MNDINGALLVSFGNYLLSEERNESVSEENKLNVTHADVENWKDKVREALGWINNSPIKVYITNRDLSGGNSDFLSNIKSI